MKSNVLKSVFFLLIGSQIYAQQTSMVDVGGIPQNINYSSMPTVTTVKALTFDNVQGSPYLSKQYEVVQVEGFKDKVPARYNMYNDEVEFQKDGKTLSFPKSKEYGNIQFVDSKQSLIWLEGSEEKSGYFFVLSNGKNKLLRKNKVRFLDAKPATSSYSEPSPAKFSNMPAAYYILTEKNEWVPLKNVKEIANYFPEGKDKVNNFIKTNKIKTDKEADLIKLVSFINEN